LDYFFGANDNDQLIPPYHSQTSSAAHEAMERDQVVSISLPAREDRPMKSSLRQSRFGPNVSPNKMEAKSKELTEDISPTNGNSIVKHSSTGSSDSNGSSSRKEHESSFQNRNVSRSRSSNSVVSSTGSECGPPLGMYRGNKKETRIQRLVRIRTGYVLATLNVLLDAYGAILIKKHGVGLSTWEINFCRMGFAALFMICISGLMRLLEYRRRQESGMITKEGKRIAKWYRLPQLSLVSWITVTIGVFFVTFLSPALTNYALFEIPLALAISLGATTPIYTMPLGFIRKGQIPSRKSLIGALLSITGVCVLCLWGVDSDPFGEILFEAI